MSGAFHHGVVLATQFIMLMGGVNHSLPTRVPRNFDWYKESNMNEDKQPTFLLTTKKFIREGLQGCLRTISAMIFTALIYGVVVCITQYLGYNIKFIKLY